MTDARIEKVYEDKVRAREFLAQAQRFLNDANTTTLSSESQAVLLHNATMAACDAVLQAVGLRVTAAIGLMSSGSKPRALSSPAAIPRSS